jgi:hypothetical protein
MEDILAMGRALDPGTHHLADGLLAGGDVLADVPVVVTRALD